VTCIDDNTMLDLVDGTLDAPARDRVLRHIDDCPPCRRTAAHSVGLLAPASKHEPPATIGRYVVLDWLGEGAMGVVYRAHDPQIDREVALKVVLSDRPQLLREAQALGRISHPNVLAVFDAGIVDGGVFLACELVSGVDLRAFLARGDRLGVAEVLAIFRQAALGLAAAHRVGIVHLDFKPENILVDDDGRVRVADFGLAASAGDRAHGSGTDGYMAPEQLREGPVDARADQYAFCVSLHEALYDARPDEGDRSSRGRVPSRVRQALRRGLSTAPADRFSDMQPLIDVLAPPSRRATRSLALVSLAVVLGAAVVLARPDAEPPPRGGFVRDEPDPALEPARALRMQGRDDEAAVLVREVATQARRDGELERLAEAELLLGKLLAPAERRQEPTEMLLRAIGTAETVGRQDLRAEGLVALAAVESDDPAAAMRATHNLEQARRIIAEYALEDRLGHGADYVEGSIHFAAGRHEQAATVLARALEGATRSLPADHPFISQYRWSLALALGRVGRHEEAAPLYEQARREGVATLGRDSPRYAALLAAIAAQHANAGDCQRAVTDLEAAIAILEPQLGGGAPTVLTARGDLALCLERIGRGDEAHAHHRKAVELALPSGSAVTIAEAYARLGDHEYRSSRLADAGAAYDEALTWARRGAAGTAVEACMLTRVAMVMIEREEEGARELLEDALAIHELDGESPIDLAETEFALARAVESSDPMRAAELAERARDRVQGNGATETEHREEIEAWLRERFEAP
jgi:tetratricopeptide (TPR) repeat protein/tRNA A-37 threonylcarbamoyl transferase component Bud32